MRETVWRVKRGFQNAPAPFVGKAFGFLILGFSIGWLICYMLIFFILPIDMSRSLSRNPTLILLIIFGAIIGANYVAYTHPKISKLWLPAFDTEQAKKDWQAMDNTSSTTKTIADKIESIGQHTDHSAFVKVREHPKGTRLIYQTPDKATIEIKSAIRFWSNVLPPVLMLATFTIAPAIGGFIGNVVAGFGGAASGAVIVPILTLIAAIASYFMTRPWVRVIATPTEIQYGKLRFDRQYHQGMALGYSLDGQEDLVNDFHDLSLGLRAIRCTYGRWGEDLPYLVNKYHGAEIIIWMNEIIASVGAPEPAEQDLEQGRKKEEF